MDLLSFDLKSSIVASRLGDCLRLGASYYFAYHFGVHFPSNELSENDSST
jgi:hypothetical protein